ncbi:MAG: DUF4255 domain-containing protein [Butyrivibrio sp.]|jgi:hypothetical protein|uniref:DUF4255 domain-containing protein n=1 Tax=Butyrivibrio sp. TaxID=28121 RepID=UPI001B6E5304|nr:DUF4255 domain-containing protein [Butyrivibrio sp.]MBE5829030.1 DUF4255 domain-containing protein [Butyrivibrio sp.]MBP3784947.1 DUF4255 domain-containing protein [Butyrivibrio sp.]MBP3814255.1 DUF4255 domain-containing protein [Butyrivibrio sp.]
MADYPIIADVSQFIVKTLRDKMCPEPIPSPNNIEISSPTSQDVDYLVGVYLYDIREEAEVSTPRYIQKGRTQITKPPRPYSLYYMVFINGSGQMGLKDPDMQKIIGKIAQIVNDNNSIYPNELQNWLDVPEPPIVLSQAKISLEEKERVWRMVNKPYQISLFYRAAPVYLSSGEFINTPRVSDASFEIGVTGEERG